MPKQNKLLNKFMSGILVLVSGPSGVGKSEVVKRMLTYQELNCHQLVNITTRSPRSREIEEKDYYFVSREEFLKNIANNQFLDYVEYNNNYYGTPLNSLREGLSTKNILQIVNVEGFQNIRKIWKGKIEKEQDFQNQILISLSE